jgi:two-component system, chemotaxis family, sensor kinase CheA
MRQAPIAAMLGRVALAVEAEARRSGREVVVRTLGGELTVDRRIAEQLADPCLHLARNAVAHGIEPPEQRVAAGKPPQGTITLSVKKTTSRLRITIEDDGAGVDVADIRRRSVEAGSVTKALADAADDDTLLALLFLPGFSTRESSDLLAGRGIGLDIALAAVQRLSGGIRLSSRLGEGFTASVEVPVDTGMSRIVWVEAAGEEYALVAGQVARVRPNQGELVETTPHLAACLGREGAATAMLALDLVTGDTDSAPARIGIDRVGAAEDQLIRPLTPLVAAMGPFAGAIVRGDGSVRLALDGYALAPRARALGRLPSTSDRPREA